MAGTKLLAGLLCLSLSAGAAPAWAGSVSVPELLAPDAVPSGAPTFSLTLSPTDAPSETAWFAASGLTLELRGLPAMWPTGRLVSPVLLETNRPRRMPGRLHVVSARTALNALGAAATKRGLMMHILDGVSARQAGLEERAAVIEPAAELTRRLEAWRVQRNRSFWQQMTKLPGLQKLKPPKSPAEYFRAWGLFWFGVFFVPGVIPVLACLAPVLVRQTLHGRKKRMRLWNELLEHSAAMPVEEVFSVLTPAEGVGPAETELAEALERLSLEFRLKMPPVLEEAVRERIMARMNVKPPLFRRVLTALAAAAAIGAGPLFLHGYLNDASVPRRETLIPAGAPRVVMTLFPHPDDEISAWGTLRAEREQGAEIILVSLTRGEAGPTGGFKREQLGSIRTREMGKAAHVLGAQKLEVLDFPDSGIKGAAPALLKEKILELILKHRPSVLITYDENVGLYGHPDHRLTAQYTREVFDEHREDAGFPVRTIYRVTLPSGMIKAGFRVSRYFRDHYPQDPALGLPPPDTAVTISHFGALKKEALYMHESQREVLDDLQPLIRVIPGWLYYRIFDTEYFSSYPQPK